jgi:hypothetical protein
VLNAQGAHIKNRVDEYWIETPRAAQRSLKTTQAPPRPQTPEEKLRTMSDAEKRQSALKALTVGVPTMPRVLDAVVARQREQGKIV